MVHRAVQHPLRISTTNKNRHNNSSVSPSFVSFHFFSHSLIEWTPSAGQIVQVHEYTSGIRFKILVWNYTTYVCSNSNNNRDSKLPGIHSFWNTCEYLNALEMLKHNFVNSHMKCLPIIFIDIDNNNTGGCYCCTLLTYAIRHLLHWPLLH